MAFTATRDLMLPATVTGSWHHYPLQRWTGLEHEELQTEKTRSPETSSSRNSASPSATSRPPMRPWRGISCPMRNR